MITIGNKTVSTPSPHKYMTSTYKWIEWHCSHSGIILDNNVKLKFEICSE